MRIGKRQGLAPLPLPMPTAQASSARASPPWAIRSRIPKIKDPETINIIARVLDNGDHDSVAIAIVGDSADININARDLDIEDRDSVAIVIVGDPSHG